MNLALMKAVFPILDHIWSSVGAEDGKTYTFSLQACRLHDEIDITRLELVELLPYREDVRLKPYPESIAALTMQQDIPIDAPGSADQLGQPSHAELMDLWQTVVGFRDRHQISHDEKIYDTDKIAEEATTFIADCITITGFGDHDDADEYVGGIATRSQG